MQIQEIYDAPAETFVRTQPPRRGRMTWREGPKRLCMVVHGPYPIGEPRVAREAAAALADGYAVEVVAMRRTGEPAQELVDGVLVTRLPIRHARGGGIGRVLAEYLVFAALATSVVGARTVRRGYDVIHVHNPPDFLIIAAAVPRLFGSRVIFDIHDPSPEMFAMRFPGRVGMAAGVILRRLERLATVLADAVLTVHEPYRREMIARGIPETKVAVVMNSLDERLLPAPKLRPRGSLRVVYHGTVTPPYGASLLVDAAARLAVEVPELRVEIIGEGDGIPELRERVRSLRLSDRVAIDGEYIPHREALERVSGASVGVVPNLPTRLNRFALSSKLLEYVALGVPVVSADLPTIREYFSADEIQFFEPGSSDSLADALLAVIHDPDRAAARAERARRRYEAYRWGVNAPKYLTILDHLSSRSKASAIRVTRRRHGEGSP
jgi:glycosyltransferase involved in cell wall biosynthesis